MNSHSRIPSSLLSSPARVRFMLGVCLAALPAFIASPASAVNYVKANNNTALTVASSYVANSGTPTSAADFIVFDSNFNTTTGISNTGALTFGGFIVGADVAGGGPLAFGSSSTSTWTLGSGTITGVQTLIDMSVANVDMTLNNANGTLRLTGGSGSTMIFNVAANRTLTINQKVSAQGNNKKLELQGAGNVIFNASINPGALPFAVNIAGSNVTLNAANTFVLGTGAFTVSSGSLNVGNDGALGGVTTIVANGGNINSSGAARTLTQAITLGGDVNFGGAFDLSLSGTLTGATRRVSYNGGQIFKLTGAGSSILGLSLLNGTGVIDTGGSVTAAGFSSIGVTAGSTAIMTVKGTGAFTSNGDFNVGDTGSNVTAATGTLNIQDTSTVVIGAAGGLYLGASFLGGTDLSSGTVNQTGGTLTHNNTAAGTFVIGGRNGAQGTGIYNLSAGTTTAKGQVYVGGAGTGTLNISGTGIFDAQLGLKLGNNSNGSATSAGTVNLDGGTLSVGAAGVSNGAGTGTFNFNGGTLKANATSTTFMTGVTNAFIKDGGAVIDTNNVTVTIAQVLQNFAGATTASLTKTNGGTLILSTAGNTYSGTTNVTGGTLQVSSAGNTQTNLIGTGALNLSNGGRFRFNSTSASTFNNALDVGTGGGTISVRGGTTFSPTAITGSGALALDIDNAVTLTPTTFNGWNGAVNVGTTGAGATFRMASTFDNTSLGNAALNLGAGISMTRNAGTNGAFTTNIGTLSGAAGSFIGGSAAGSGTYTFSIGARNDAATFAGNVVDGSTKTALTKVGSGIQTMSGTNSYTGPTNVSGGALEVTGSLSGTTGVTVNTGGTLLLNSAASDIVKTTATVAMAGGTLAFGNAANQAQALGALTLSLNSTIDFGAGGGADKFLFGGFSHTAGTTLTINNWLGNVAGGTDGTDDRLVFSGLYTDFTSSFSQAQISFSGYGSGYAAIDFGGTSYEIVPVPEPATTALLGSIALVGLIGLRERRRVTRRAERTIA